MTPYRDGNTVIDLDYVCLVRPVVSNRERRKEGVHIVMTGGNSLTLWGAEATAFMDRYNHFINEGQYAFTVLAEAA